MTSNEKDIILVLNTEHLNKNLGVKMKLSNCLVMRTQQLMRTYYFTVFVNPSTFMRFNL